MKSNWLNLSARVGLPVAGLALQASVAWAQVGPELCGPLFVPPSAPPWDFNVDKFFLPVVVDNHFTAPVEALIRGQTNRIVGPDIDYTLRRFPNHPRALNAAVRLSERDQTKVENSLPLPVECYFERALRFRPKDAVPRMMYAQWLAKRKRTEEAIKNLEFVAENNADSPNHLQTIGLVYFEFNQFDRALDYAHRARALNPNLKTLSDALLKAGRWKEPPPVPGRAASAPAAAASAASAPG